MLAVYMLICNFKFDEHVVCVCVCVCTCELSVSACEDVQVCLLT